jgi:hypothetical protein
VQFSKQMPSAFPFAITSATESVAGCARMKSDLFFGREFEGTVGVGFAGSVFTARAPGRRWPRPPSCLSLRLGDHVGAVSVKGRERMNLEGLDVGVRIAGQGPRYHEKVE